MNKRGEPNFLSDIVKFRKKKEPVFKAHRQKTIPDKEEEVTYEDGIPSI